MLRLWQLPQVMISSPINCSLLIVIINCRSLAAFGDIGSFSFFLSITEQKWWTEFFLWAAGKAWMSASSSHKMEDQFWSSSQTEFECEHKVIKTPTPAWKFCDCNCTRISKTYSALSGLSHILTSSSWHRAHGRQSRVPDGRSMKFCSVVSCIFAGMLN